MFIIFVYLFVFNHDWVIPSILPSSLSSSPLISSSLLSFLFPPLLTLFSLLPPSLGHLFLRPLFINHPPLLHPSFLSSFITHAILPSSILLFLLYYSLPSSLPSYFVPNTFFYFSQFFLHH